jgi:hypothetical protein
MCPARHMPIFIQGIGFTQTSPGADEKNNGFASSALIAASTS